MSILFQGRATGATAVKQSLWNRFVMFWVHHIRQALTSLGEIWLTPASSLLTVAVLGVSLTLPVTLHLMVKNLQQVSTSVDQAAQISLFLKADTNETQIAELIALLQANPDVADVQFIDKSQALAEFTAESGFGDALSYIEENPLPHVMLVSPKNTSSVAASALLNALQQERYVELAKLDIGWLERLDAIVSLVRQVAIAVALLLMVAVLLVVGNTIRLMILNKKDEIEVMKLVGATNSYIQRPFLYTGIWLGFFGGILTFLIEEVLLWWLKQAIASVTQLYESSFTLQPLSLAELGYLLLVAVTLGFLGSFLAVRRNISQIEATGL
jgi:cell division transport system permease protein